MASYLMEIRNYVEWAITTGALMLTLIYGFDIAWNVWMAFSIFLVLATFDTVQHQLRGK
jgi:hypothetical protein